MCNKPRIRLQRSSVRVAHVSSRFLRQTERIQDAPRVDVKSKASSTLNPWLQYSARVLRIIGDIMD